MKFRKKPVVIDAVQWLGGRHVHEQVYFLASKFTSLDCEHCSIDLDDHGYVNTLSGRVMICPGDWICEGVKGEFYPCKPDIFEMTYEPEDK